MASTIQNSESGLSTTYPNWGILNFIVMDARHIEFIPFGQIAVRRVAEEGPLSPLFHGLWRRQQDQLGDQRDREQLDGSSLRQNEPLDPQSRRNVAVQSSRL